MTPSPPSQFTAAENDAIRRTMNSVNIHVQARIAGANAGMAPQFVAIHLDDGSSNGELYDTRADAVRMTGNDPRVCMYIRVGVDSMPFREAAIVLMQHRQAYARGVRFGEEAPVTPQLSELLTPYLPRTLAALERYNRR